jgi:phosphatidate phosphatase APP1
VTASDTKVHRAARIEDVVHGRIEHRLSARGWVPAVKPYTGYGAPGWVRVMCRLLLTRPDLRRRPEAETGSVRGWRSFATTAVTDTEVVVQAGSHRHVVRTDRSGYVDAVVRCDLPVGWWQVGLMAEGAEPVQAPVRVIGPNTTFGIVSDVDDTVLVTSLPRPMLAAWNTFVLDEHARAPVPGMAVLFERLANAHPNAAFFYISTGAWNVAPALTRFLGRHLYPPGPLLLTDWGPTRDAWFRNGRAHKRAQLQRLAHELPQVKWLLIGDDGQHDPELYADFVDSHPGRVAGVAIRHLSPTEQVLASGLPVPADSGPRASSVPWVSAPNGADLSRRLVEAGLL